MVIAISRERDRKAFKTTVVANCFLFNATSNGAVTNSYVENCCITSLALDLSDNYQI